jgi:hypothetical protein
MKRALQILILKVMFNGEPACGKQACLSGRQAAYLFQLNNKI